MYTGGRVGESSAQSLWGQRSLGLNAGGSRQPSRRAMAAVTKNRRRRSLSLRKVLLIGLAVIAVLETIALIAATYGPGWLAVTLVGIIGFALTVAVALRVGREAAVSGLVGITGAGLMIIAFGTSKAWGGGEVLNRVSVETAASAPTAAGFRFTDAVVRLDLTATYTPGSTTREGAAAPTFRVAPLVTSDWHPNMPVSAWVGCVGQGCDQDWAEVRITRRLNDYAKAVAKAESTFQLRSSPGAPVLRWVRDPQQAINRRVYAGWAVALGTPVLWLTVLPMMRWARRRGSDRRARS